MISREEDIIELFFNDPAKHWHFEEILREVGIARSKANKWLKRFVKERMIKRVKEKGKMPYYIGMYESPDYQNKKRLFALKKLNEMGLLNHLSGLEEAKTVIVFGSFTRWDWYKGSDIDVFIYGNPKGLSIGKYEIKLHRDIQLFICKSKKQLRKLGSGLIRNIVKGDIIKGDIHFLRVGLNA
jgi:predicted nucleotidyltransferase